MAFLEKYSIAPDRRYSDWTQDEIEKLRAGVADGLTDYQVAVRLGRTMRAVRRQRTQILGIRHRKIGPSGEWTAERVQQLTDLAAEGWSNGQIALRMGFSRNAVIGKRDRLGLPKRGPGMNVDLKSLPHKPRKDGHASRYGKVRKVKAKVIPLHVVDPLRVGFMELKRNHCRWVLDEQGADGLALYCGHEKLGMHSYCPGHYRLSTDRSKDRRFVWANPPLNKVFG